MRELLILRHAKSSWATDAADHDRPLNPRGRETAPRIGDLMARLDIVPDRIMASSAHRTIATAEAVRARLGLVAPIQVDADLYLATPEHLIETIQRQGGSDTRRLLLVGHNPGLEELVFRLTGESVTLPTAALARIALPIDDWGALRISTTGTLLGLWSPKLSVRTGSLANGS